MENQIDIKGSIKTIQQLVDDIKSAIITGKLNPGQRLVEARLCELFSVKRNRVRDAFRILEVEGFVQITPNVGAAVRGFSRKDVENTYDLQSILDGLAVRLATPLLRNKQLNDLEDLLGKMESTDNLMLFAQYNDSFHKLFCTHSGNERLVKLSENLRVNIKVFGHRSFFVPGQIAASISEHREIFRTVSAKKAQKAEQIIRDHVIDAKNRLLNFFSDT